MAFRNTWVDYLIFFGATFVFLYFFIDMHYTKPIEIAPGVLGQIMNVQIIIAPLIAIHRVVLIIAGIYEVRQLRDFNKRLWIALQIQKIKDKFRSGIDEYCEWKNGK